MKRYIMLLATATIAIILLSGCSAKKNLNGSVYYKEAQIVERKIATKCSIEKCSEPIDMRILKHTAENREATYTERAIALRTYVPMLEAYAECLHTQLKACIDSNSTSASAETH